MSLPSKIVSYPLPRLLNHRPSRPPTSQEDLADWSELSGAMDTVGFTAVQLADISRVLAAVLALGNAKFEDSNATGGGVARMADGGAVCALRAVDRIPRTALLRAEPRSQQWLTTLPTPPLSPLLPLSPQGLGVAANLLKVSPKALETSICVRQMEVSGEAVVIQRDAAGCTDTRDALAKAVYVHLFSWVIDNVNRALSSSTVRTSTAAAEVSSFLVH